LKVLSQVRYLWSALFIAGIVMLAACGGSSKSASAPHYKVNVPVSVANLWSMTVNSVTTNPGTAAEKPQTGHTYLVVEVTLKNISSEAQPISSLLQFQLSDSANHDFSQTVTSFSQPPSGLITPSDAVHGVLAFEVPTTMQQFTLSFQPSASSTGKTYWDVKASTP
jgi:Domain of unknown function (DUF4352)